MDEVELECWDLLRSVGMPFNSASSPKTETSEGRKETLVKEKPSAGDSKETARRYERDLDRTSSGGETWTSSRRDRSRSPDRRGPIPIPSRTRSQYSPSRDVSLAASRDLYDPYTLFLPSMDPRLSQKQLQSLFEPFGKIVDTRVRTVGQKFAGFVQFKHTRDAERARGAMDNTIIGSTRSSVINALARAASATSASTVSQPVPDLHSSSRSPERSPSRSDNASASSRPQRERSRSPVIASSYLRGRPPIQAEVESRTLVCENLPPHLRTSDLKCFLPGSADSQIRISRAPNKLSASASLVFPTRFGAEVVRRLDGIMIAQRKIIISFLGGPVQGHPPGYPPNHLTGFRGFSAGFWSRCQEGEERW
ncbi:hypothetical protein BDY24DRAFT_389860 [Mrakia frigida]|uniref:uncharacterized protein n=1 Tax=Mrakia frigida TaxID=29902 RepID=UPI003FCBF464